MEKLNIQIKTLIDICFKKNNYQICGKVNFKGADRVAFDKVLKERF